mgnify:CR=1 FL=1
MNNPEVYCKKCYLVQEYDLENPPEKCKQCGTRFSTFEVVSQLTLKAQGTR